MSRYIDAEALIHFIEEKERHCIPTKNGTDKPISTNTMKMVINQADTVDVVEIKHGKWIQFDKNKCRCSNCDVITLVAQYPHGDKNYCPNCGAKMDSEDND